MPSSCGAAPEFTEQNVPDLTGYVIIVTGGTSGIGYETTLQLALRNARVYIANRSLERAKEAMQKMQQASHGHQLDLKHLKMDLQDLQSVKAAANWFLQQESRLDILINNAGIMAVPFALTNDGYELSWQVNYLSPFVLTTALMPLLLATASQSKSQTRVRVVNVSSDAAFFSGPKHIRLDDVNMKDAKGMTELWQRYSHSKQAVIRFAKELNDRYSQSGVTAYSLHPGIVQSNLQSHDPSFLGSAIRVAVKVAAHTTPLEGSYNSLFCATSPMAPIRGQGCFFIPVAKLEPKADTWLSDIGGNAALWNHSEKVVASLN